MDKKKLFLIISVIFISAILLRLVNLNKPEGLWNDEYLTWEIAKAALPKEFFEAVMRNCHAPLHYLYLKLWMHFFGDEDTILRLSSLIPGALSVIVIFFAARNASKKTDDSAGIYAAAFCAISSFLIYFSQELRIYSLLFLLSALNIYTALKTLENPSKKNCTLFVITSLLVMLEHTIGFVFVFFSAVGVILFAASKAKFKKYLLTAFLIAFIVFIPVAIFLYKVMFNSEYFSQWWAPFSFAKLGFFFTDLFSPYLINITNAPPQFFGMLYDGANINYGFLIFAIIPLFICLICMLKSVFAMERSVKYLLLTSAGVYLTVFLASACGKIVFLTKYLTEIYPALIILTVLGLVSFKSKAFKTILATVYLVISLFFYFVSQLSPVQLVRGEGQRIPVLMLYALDYKPSDKVMFLYYPKDRISKYSKEIAKNPNVSHISKYDFLFINGNNETMPDTYKNGKERYRNTFLSQNNVFLDNFLNSNIYNNIKKGDRFFLVDFSPVSFFSPDEFNTVIKDDKKYSETPFLFLVFSYLRNYTVLKSKSLLSFSGVSDNSAWRIYVFEKT